jgi:hypothetical protein
VLPSTFLSLLNMGPITSTQTTSAGSNATSPKTVKKALCYMNLGCRIIAVGILAAFLNQTQSNQFLNDGEKFFLIAALVSYGVAICMEVLYLGVCEAYPEAAWQGKLEAVED